MSDNNNVLNSVLNIVKSCDSLQLCTNGLNQYPETRHVTNAMNTNVNNLFELHFMTSNKSPKYAQLAANANCCLYYFNPDTRHAVRLFGQMEFVNSQSDKMAHWNDDYKKFGYSGFDDESFALMRFVPDSYKFYIGSELHAGKI